MIRAVLILGVVVTLSSVAVGQSESTPSQVDIYETGAGFYFQTDAEQSLYWNVSENAAGEVTCVEECLTMWNPLVAKVDAKKKGLWSPIERPEGTSQWSYDGKPIYTYARDTFSGARLGDGLGRGQWQLLWEPLEVPAGMRMESTYLGFVLADHRGRTLYVANSTIKAEVSQDSMSPWAPFKAPWLALDQGDWTVQAADDGARQWFYRGQPLFTYAKDNDSGDVHGHRLNGEWTAVVLEPAQGLPAWITIQSVDLGLAYANEEGLTIYAPVDIEAIKRAQTCPAACMEQNWRPILPQPGETSVGNWVIVENEDGQLQWSFKGQLLYTHTRDEKPGDMKGNGIAVGYRIGDGWRIIPVDSGLRRSRI